MSDKYIRVADIGIGVGAKMEEMLKSEIQEGPGDAG